ncbi:hypothetical protein C1646_760502 [Rhizophagus diaphanus]|nr:hypothetical protein C1646_760502 [Rhizophagus diaphanus] [Rhizophagus sp. MUCL 43196]
MVTLSFLDQENGSLSCEVQRLSYTQIKQERAIAERLGSYSGPEPKTTEKEASYYGTSKYASTNKLKSEMDILLTTYPNISIPKKQQHGNVCMLDSHGNPYTYELYDTAILELRPLKRDVNVISNLSSHLITLKRSRQVTSSIVALDSELAGPSKVNNN